MSLLKDASRIMQAHRVLGGWQDVVVTSSSVLPHMLVHALLSCSAKAVVCKRAGTPECKAELSAAFFSVLCTVLASGRCMEAALDAAGEPLLLE